MPAHREADVARWARLAIPAVSGAQAQIAAMTDQYLAAVQTAASGTTVRPVGVPATAVTTEALRGVPAVDVYRRPGVTVWTALAEGMPYSQAVNLGLLRALNIAVTDLQLAKTHTSQQVLEQAGDRVVGYRRVLDGNSCALCAVASTQRYHRGDLMPIHPGCGCDVAPIVGDTDPGQVINADRLAQVHDAIAETFGVSSESARQIGTPNGLQYRDVIVQHQHGELGPVIAVRGQRFTGPADL